MRENEDHTNINHYDLSYGHLIDNRLYREHKVLVWFDSINLCQSKGPVRMKIARFDKI